MSSLCHIPALRLGTNYESVEKGEVKDFRTGEIRATVSQVNAGLIRKDLKRLPQARSALKKFTTIQLLEMCARAGEQFLSGSLPLAAGRSQTPQQYVEALSATSGLPHVMVRRNMDRIHQALVNMRGILNGLTREVDYTILDDGFGQQAGVSLSFFPTTSGLGVVMPSNSPSVNSLWLPAIPLKIPVVIKPGREEPWT